MGEVIPDAAGSGALNSRVPLAAGGLEAVQAPAFFIQPHGALIVLDAHGVMTHRSRNAVDLLPGLTPLDKCLPFHLWDTSGPLRSAVEQVLHDLAGAQGDLPFASRLTLQGRVFDVLVHAAGQLVLVEFELRPADGCEPPSASALAHHSMNRLKRLHSIDAILEEAVVTLRKLTGFDRVTAYCFRPDDSSEVVAEDRNDALEGFAGTRFMATDVPVQARPFYTLNTLRLVADIHDRQVPVDTIAPDVAATDLIRSVLRSVSPIHNEYLKRLGAAASMSLSIVVEGRLWGVIACHHATAHRVSYAVRMTCDVLMQFVSSVILVTQEKAAILRRSVAAGLRSRLVDVALHAGNVLESFKPICVELQHSMNSDALLLMHQGRLEQEGLTPATAVLLAGWLESQPDPLVVLNELSGLPFDVRTSLMPFCGLLAICFDRQRRGWMVLLRQQHVQTIAWNFPPDRIERSGPPNTLLTQTGPVAIERQERQGLSTPWDDVDRSLAHGLADELGRAATLRNSEMEDAYVQLMGMLGHDLRDPLQTISMVGRVLSLDNPASPMGQRIATSTGRMQRLITQVLDMSRLRSGNGLGIARTDCDMATLVCNWVDEARFSYPSVTIELDSPATLPMHVDSDRVAQVISNLVSNARHHGVIGEPIRVALSTHGAVVRLTVSNVAPAFSEGLIDVLFDPLKRIGAQQLRNPGGLGLGLYIAREVAKSHGGTLRYSHDGTHVVFTMEIGSGRQVTH